MDDSEKTAKLAEAAAELRFYSDEAVKSEAAVIDSAVKAGRALLQAQAKMRTEDWLPWLDANFNGSREIAAEYMRIAASV